MAENPNCGIALGVLLLVFPIIALIFGSNEPAMQTDNAALVMTGMMFFGIIMIATNSSKRSKMNSQPTQLYAATPTYTTGDQMAPQHTSQVMQEGGSFCPYCGAAVNKPGAKFCAKCGAEIN
jgi:hypothetical protein